MKENFPILKKTKKVSQNKNQKNKTNIIKVKSQSIKNYHKLSQSKLCQMNHKKLFSWIISQRTNQVK